MDTDRPPPTPPLFFCFTSSSSSMKMSSKSILSPGRYSREPAPPLARSTSLSRRLSKSRSVRGGAPPAMFPVTGKKRGFGFDNPEPSSPKVTCIGQVRVKTRKKHARNLRTLSRRRKLEHSRSQSQHLKCFRHRNRNSNSNSNTNNNHQRWVHIPLTICEALRTFGSEFSCLFPCRSSCSSTTTPMENEGKTGVGSARWLVAVQDGDAGGRDDGYEEMDVRNVRRHVFDKLKIVNDVIVGSNDEGRVSVCVPPKNALLLMRGRSDPVKMEALTNQFLDVIEEKPEDEESIYCEDKMEENKIHQEVVELEDEKLMVLDEVKDAEEIKLELEVKESVQGEKEEMVEKQSIKEEDDTKQSMEINEEEDDQEQSMEINEEEEESFFIGCLFEENEDQDQELEVEEADTDMEDAQQELLEDVQEPETGESNMEEIKHFEERNEEMLTQFTEGCETGESNREEIKHFEQGNEEILTQFTERSETGESNKEEIKHLEEGNDEMFTERSKTGDSNVKEIKHFEEEIEEMLTEFTERSETGESNIEEIKHFEKQNEEMLTQFTEKSETAESNIEEIKHFEEENEEMLTHFTKNSETRESNNNQIKQFEEEIEEMLTKFTERSETLEREKEEKEEREKSNKAMPECLLLMMYEPKLSMEVSKETWVSSSDFMPRHSGRKPPLPVDAIDCHDESKVNYEPVAQPRSMIAMLEQKLVNTMGFEPLVLTRCKSEPMRRAPETCCWQNQLEPPRRVSFGVGMAGLAG